MKKHWKEFDFKKATTDEISTKLEECVVKRESLLKTYGMTGHNDAYMKMIRLESFISAMQAEMHCRSVPTYSELSKINMIQNMKMTYLMKYIEVWFDKEEYNELVDKLKDIEKEALL